MKIQDSRQWHQVDAATNSLGRLATQVAALLMGKHKPGFVRHRDNGDYVVVTNVEKVVLTGKKASQKIYQRYSGYPSGRKEFTVQDVMEKNSDQMVRHAVRGMLPKNKLRPLMLRRLRLVTGDQNPYQDKFKKISS
jgi:large subunit ribosomal protein L13